MGFGQQLPDSWGSARSGVSGSDPNILLCDSSWHSQGFVESLSFERGKECLKKGKIFKNSRGSEGWTESRTLHKQSERVMGDQVRAVMGVRSLRSL